MLTFTRGSWYPLAIASTIPLFTAAEQSPTHARRGSTWEYFFEALHIRKVCILSPFPPCCQRAVTVKLNINNFLVSNNSFGYEDKNIHVTIML